jgi:flagellar FliJ protein
MAKFKFRLATLLRLRNAARDERRGQLAEAYRADEIIQDKQRQLAEELDAIGRQQREASGPGPIDVDRLLSDQRYAFLLAAQQGHTERQRVLLAAELERRRQLLMEANREVRVLEKLEERQRDRHQEEENRREIKQVDEIAQRRAAPEEAP